MSELVRAGDLLFGALSFGGANIGNLFQAMSDEDAFQLMNTVWDAGVRSFDTAPHYGLGLSERRMGSFLATKPRDEYVLSTKVGRLIVDNPSGTGQQDIENGFAVPADHARVWDFSTDGVRRSLDESLKRLGLDRVDILYLHDPDEFDTVPAISTGVPAAALLRDEGLVRAVGVGSKSVDALLAGVLTDMIDLVMIAGRYTLLDQSAADRLLPSSEARGVGVANAGVFNSGLLAKTHPDNTAHYEYGAVPEPVLKRALSIAAVCDRHGVELPAAALQYPLRNSLVRTVVVGASSEAQFMQTTQRMGSVIPEALWRELREEQLISS